jgi:hypothetical protein
MRLGGPQLRPDCDAQAKRHERAHGDRPRENETERPSTDDKADDSEAERRE